MLPPFSYGIKYYADDKNDVKQVLFPTNNWLIRLTRLKEYCDRINEAGFHFMLSNSDCKGKNEEDNFFDVLYGAYHRTRIFEQNGTPNIVCRNYNIN